MKYLFPIEHSMPTQTTHPQTHKEVLQIGGKIIKILTVIVQTLQLLI